VAIAASRSVVVDVLKRSDVYAILKDPKRLGRPIPPKTRSLNNAIKFEHLDKLKILGIGTFGRVWIVKDRSTSTSYALKILDKAQIIAHHQVSGAERSEARRSEAALKPTSCVFVFATP
jgi:serine/threonine protein kinase